jgi:hypothetical protein
MEEKGSRDGPSQKKFQRCFTTKAVMLDDGWERLSMRTEGKRKNKEIGKQDRICADPPTLLLVLLLFLIFTKLRYERSMSNSYPSFFPRPSPSKGGV